MVTWQCEDKRTGGTQLMHLKAADDEVGDVECPFLVSEPVECVTDAHCKEDEACQEGVCVGIP